MLKYISFCIGNGTQFPVLAAMKRERSPSRAAEDSHGVRDVKGKGAISGGGGWSGWSGWYWYDDPDTDKGKGTSSGWENNDYGDEKGGKGKPKGKGTSKNNDYGDEKGGKGETKGKLARGLQEVLAHVQRMKLMVASVKHDTEDISLRLDATEGEVMDLIKINDVT